MFRHRLAENLWPGSSEAECRWLSSWLGAADVAVGGALCVLRAPRLCGARDDFLFATLRPIQAFGARSRGVGDCHVVWPVLFWRPFLVASLAKHARPEPFSAKNLPRVGLANTMQQDIAKVWRCAVAADLAARGCQTTKTTKIIAARRTGCRSKL